MRVGHIIQDVSSIIRPPLEIRVVLSLHDVLSATSSNSLFSY